jgi:hypothetical protein
VNYDPHINQITGVMVSPKIIMKEEEAPNLNNSEPDFIPLLILVGYDKIS